MPEVRTTTPYTVLMPDWGYVRGKKLTDLQQGAEMRIQVPGGSYKVYWVLEGTNIRVNGILGLATNMPYTLDGTRVTEVAEILAKKIAETVGTDPAPESV